MNEVQRLRDEAARAERWAQALSDTRMVEQLKQIAKDYMRRADALQRQSA